MVSALDSNNFKAVEQVHFNRSVVETTVRKRDAYFDACDGILKQALHRADIFMYRVFSSLPQSKTVKPQ